MENEPLSPHEEVTLNGPVQVAPGDENVIARHILVQVPPRIYIIPLHAQGCRALSEALAVTDDELAQMTARQRAATAVRSRVVLPNGGPPGGPSMK